MLLCINIQRKTKHRIEGAIKQYTTGVKRGVSSTGVPTLLQALK